MFQEASTPPQRGIHRPAGVRQVQPRRLPPWRRGGGCGAEAPDAPHKGSEVLTGGSEPRKGGLARAKVPAVVPQAAVCACRPLSVALLAMWRHTNLDHATPKGVLSGRPCRGGLRDSLPISRQHYKPAPLGPIKAKF
jgi:hypothetical protein